MMNEMVKNKNRFILKTFKLVAVLSQMDSFEGNTGSFSFDKARPIINSCCFFLYFGHLTKQAANKNEK